MLNRRWFDCLLEPEAGVAKAWGQKRAWNSVRRHFCCSASFLASVFLLLHMVENDWVHFFSSQSKGVVCQFQIREGRGSHPAQTNHPPQAKLTGQILFGQGITGGLLLPQGFEWVLECFAERGPGQSTRVYYRAHFKISNSLINNRGDSNCHIWVPTIC